MKKTEKTEERRREHLCSEANRGAVDSLNTDTSRWMVDGNKHMASGKGRRTEQSRNGEIEKIW